MFTIGIRSKPDRVIFAIVNLDSMDVINLDEIIVPMAFDVPDALKYVRSNLLDILREYDVERAGIRATEPSAKRPSIARIQLEGVILEAFASSPMKGYYIGHISSIAARLGVPRNDLKPMIDGLRDTGVAGWGDMSKEEREAVLCAIGAKGHA